MSYRVGGAVTVLVALWMWAPVGCTRDGGPSAASPGSSARPPVFDARPYLEARRAAETEGKLFLVKATAAWCGPCRQMDATTWRDESVVRWLEDRAIVVAVDVDEQPTIARDLAARALPTVIAYRGGGEVGRVVGMQPAPALLRWLEGLEPEAVPRAPVGAHVDVQARLDRARSLLAAREFDAAADEYAWLWEHMLEHGRHWVVLRGSFMVGDMTALARQHSPARERFVALRDATGRRLVPQAAAVQELRDFIALNDVVGEPERTLEWFDSVKGQPAWSQVLASGAIFLQGPLVGNGRWEDLGALLADPLQQLDVSRQLLDQASAEASGTDDAQAVSRAMADMARQRLRDDAAVLYVALLSARRDDEAASVARRALEIDASPAMVQAIIARALKAGVPRAEQIEFIETARSMIAADGTDDATGNLDQLAEAVQEALAVPPATP